MFNSRILYKFLDVCVVLAIFLTPLLFFIQSRDQFELPKLTFLTVLALPLLALQIKENGLFRWTLLSLTLLFFFLTQALASLPSTSLSWRTSLLGDYENFAGLTTLVAYLVWFWALSRVLNESKIEKLFFFNSLTALLSSLYAIGQHFQFDFIQWNPESVNASREFASMGNPNFLSAYLAMSIPLYLYISIKKQSSNSHESASPEPLFWIFGLFGFVLLVLGTPKGLSLLNLPPSPSFNFALRTLGLVLFSLFGLRLVFVRSWPALLGGLTLLCLGLFSTASRGGFLGAAVGLALWAAFTLSKNETREALSRKWRELSKPYLALCAFLAMAFLAVFGRSFLGRLAFSILHLGLSLETSRLHIWRPAVKIIQANPLHGVGLDTFKIAFPYYSGIEFNQIDGMFMSSRMAHNELLQVTATTGFVGLAAYLSVLATFFLLWLKAYRSSSPNVQGLLASLLASAAAYHVQNLFSFGVAGINFLWFLFLAVVQHFYRKTKSGLFDRSGRPETLLRNAVIVVVVVAVLLFPMPRLGADIAFGRGSAVSEMLKKTDPQMDPSELLAYSSFQVEELKKAVDLCPLDPKYRLYLGLAYEQRAKLDADHSRDWLMEALGCYQKAAQMSPANAYYYNDEGRIYTDLGPSDPQYLLKAVDAFSQAVNWSPASPFFILNEAMALRKVGQAAKAEGLIQKSFQLDPAFSAKVLSQMAFESYRTGDKKTAFQNLGEAIQGNTSSAEAYYCRGILYLSEKQKKKALEDLETVRSLHPSPEKNPSIQALDQFIKQAKQ